MKTEKRATLEAFRPAKSIGALALSAEEILKCAQAGIFTLELSYGQLGWCNDIPWKLWKTTAETAGVELWSFHLPFAPFKQVDISAVDKTLRTSCVKQLSELIRAAGDIGVRTAVIHPSGEPMQEEERTEKINCAKESLVQLAQVAEESGMVIAVENLPRTCLGRDSADMLELLSADRRLMSCFDTNHLLAEPAEKYLQAVGERIITTHVSDYDFKNERHWLPGEGEIHWPRLLEQLKEIRYQGPLLYELDLKAGENIERRDLTYEDFKDNYETLMRGEQPVSIGVPVAEKCLFWK